MSKIQKFTLGALAISAVGSLTIVPREHDTPVAVSYPTRCVEVALPPHGQPLPEVCVVYPV